MATVDSFSYGKKGKRLSEQESMVRRIKTWAPRTIAQKAHEFGIKRTGSYDTFLNDLALAILNQKNGQPRP